MTDVLTLDNLLTCDQTTRFARNNRILVMAEVQEVVIDCAALFYEEGQGGENYRKKSKFRCGVNMQEKRLVKFREAIW